jgi:hypothetical protein
MKKITVTTILTAALIFTHLSSFAQVKLGDNPAVINSNSLLEMESTNKGFVPARVALSATTNSSPLSVSLLTGTIVYNTVSAGSGSTAVVPGYYYWNGTRWVAFAFSDASTTQAILEPVLDNTITDPTSLTPNDGDAYLVASSGAGAWAGQDNKIAKWDEANAVWVFYTPVSADQTTVASGTNAGNVYRYDGSNWVLQAITPSADWTLGGNSNATSANNILGTLSNNPLRFYTNGTQKMTILSNGVVGMGTASPGYTFGVTGGARLDVIGNVRAATENGFPGFRPVLAGNTAGHCPVFISYRSRGTLAAPTYPLNGDAIGLLSFRNHNNIGVGINAIATENHSASTAGSELNFTTVPNSANAAVTRMTIAHNGYVGVGTTSPDYPLHVAGTGASHASGQRIFANNVNGDLWIQNTNTAGNIKIYSDGWICTETGYIAYSDARIKHIRGVSDSRKDLAVLSEIKITDYTKIDSIADNRVYKKVIAQQVEQVYPQAVINTADYIPNVYEVAVSAVCNAKGMTTITTQKAHEFKTGDKVRLETRDKGPQFFSVTVINKHSFSVAHDFGANKVFVYGKRVNDFKSVDYEAIAMLNVSATQELAKEVAALKKELAEKEVKTASLLAELDELRMLKAEVAGIKAMMRTADQKEGRALSKNETTASNPAAQ